MKILLCHNFYQQTGGEDIAVRALKLLLEEKGHRVIFYTEDNQEIDDYGAFEKTRFFSRALFSGRTYRRICQIAEQERPDIAHVHNVFPLLSPSAYVALNQSGIPIVQTIHNYRFMCINGLFLRDGRICERCKDGHFFSGFRFRCYRDSYALSGLYALVIGSHRQLGTFERIDRFIALSGFAAQKLVESGVADASKISILENFLPVPLPEYGTSDVCNPYVCYVGRLSQEKGIFSLLEAVGAVRTLKLKILGAGPLQEKINGFIRNNRMENVEMLGFVEGEEKYRIMRNALCCVLPSECYENFPLTVLESAAVGTPVVGSRIGSLETFISEEETGLLFTPGKSDELQSKLELLIARPEMVIRMGKRAREWVESTYTGDAFYEALLKVYAQTVGCYTELSRLASPR